MHIDSHHIQFEQTYEKWRSMLFRANLLLALITFSMEVAMFFVLKSGNLIFQPLPEYLTRYLAVPTLCNVLIVSVGRWLYQRFPSCGTLCNYIPVVQFLLLCLTISATHHVFHVTLGILAFPIFTTILFGEREMTRNITVLSLVGLGITLVCRYRSMELPTTDLYFVPEAIVAAVIIVASNLIAEVLIRFQNEKSDILAAAHQREAEILDQMRHDQKTGLYGPQAFSNALRKAWTEGASDLYRPQLLVLDIDNFKKINDTHGHAQGDKVILRLARLLNEEFAADGLCARYGGEEFAVIIRNRPSDEIFFRADRLRAAFYAQRYDFMDGGVSVSIGLAAWTPESVEQWFDRGDGAMYRAKHLGKNQVAADEKKPAAPLDAPGKSVVE